MGQQPLSMLGHLLCVKRVSPTQHLEIMERHCLHFYELLLKVSRV